MWTAAGPPPWYRLAIWADRVRTMTSPQLRLGGEPHWSPAGPLAVAAFDGIRRGLVMVDPEDGSVRWWRRPAAASYRLLAPPPASGEALAVRSDHDLARLAPADQAAAGHVARR